MHNTFIQTKLILDHGIGVQTPISNKRPCAQSEGYKSEILHFALSPLPENNSTKSAFLKYAPRN